MPWVGGFATFSYIGRPHATRLHRPSHAALGSNAPVPQLHGRICGSGASIVPLQDVMNSLNLSLIACKATVPSSCMDPSANAMRELAAAAGHVTWPMCGGIQHLFPPQAATKPEAAHPDAPELLGTGPLNRGLLLEDQSGRGPVGLLSMAIHILAPLTIEALVVANEDARGWNTGGFLLESDMCWPLRPA